MEKMTEKEANILLNWMFKHITSERGGYMPSSSVLHLIKKYKFLYSGKVYRGKTYDIWNISYGRYKVGMRINQSRELTSWTKSLEAAKNFAIGIWAYGAFTKKTLKRLTNEKICKTISDSGIAGIVIEGNIINGIDIDKMSLYMEKYFSENSIWQDIPPVAEEREVISLSQLSGKIIYHYHPRDC